ncbi:hypothetical protein GAMM_70024 [Gammaproteobacteria bacterium]
MKKIIQQKKTDHQSLAPIDQSSLGIRLGGKEREAGVHFPCMTASNDVANNTENQNAMGINMTCICCPLGCDLKIDKSGTEFIITGNKCPRGKKYAIEEITAPKRIVTSTIKITGGCRPVIPVKTAAPIPKEKIFTIMDILANVETTTPIHIGDIVIKNIADTGVDVVATRTEK